jgi:DNA-binding NarL/FixJ family response regulator
MVEKTDLEHLGRAIRRMSGGADAAGWEAIPSLARLQETGFDFEIDFAASGKIGAPLVLVRERRERADALGALTARQKQVARLIARGLSNRQIASELCISLPTAKDHVHAVLARLGCSSRAGVAAHVFGKQTSRDGPRRKSIE